MNGSSDPCSHCGGDTLEHCLATPSCTGTPSECAGARARGWGSVMAEPIPDHTSVGILTNRGLIRRPDGRLARVTRRAGAWGYWENGTRVEPFATREEAAEDFMALREHRHTVEQEGEA